MRDLGAVLVTGASTGIGKATTLALDRQGFTVFAGVRRAEDQNELRRQGSGRVRPVMLDITKEEMINTSAEKIRSEVKEQGLRGLVNNAGIAVGGPLEFVESEDLRRQFEVNVVGQVAVTQAMLPLLRRGQEPRIVNIGSTAGRLATPLIGAYSASKFAMEAVTEVLRLELKPWDIHVSVIEPGMIKTPMWEKSMGAFEALIDSLPPRGKELYGSTLASAQDYVQKLEKSPPKEVAKVVVRALKAKRPKRRYGAGKNANIELFVARLPAFMREKLVSIIFPVEASS